MMTFRKIRSRFRYGDIKDAHLRRLARAIDALPDDLHETYRLARFEDLDVSAIANRLGLTEELATRHLARAIGTVTIDALRQERAAARWSRFWLFRRKHDDR